MDNELLIRIDERQQQQGEDIKEILIQVKETNGRVTQLEQSDRMQETRAVDKIKTLDEHDTRLEKVEDFQKVWKIRLATLGGVVIAAVTIAEVVVKLLFR